eukprot:Phypoly_transcript_15536.p1 GENE.Phypoly_transcript_15536~~Phypoly_transcript_15536.p1  ORF type:complete len:139 (+),score=18.19 Phypoly_transcript_15536:50-466(+)
MRARSIITTAAVCLLLICVYVNLTYLPQISKHKAEQQQQNPASSIVLDNSQRHDSNLKNDNKAKPIVDKHPPNDNHQTHDNHKVTEKPNDAPPNQNSKLAETVPLAREDIILPQVTEVPILPIDLSKIVSARIESCSG